MHAQFFTPPSGARFLPVPAYASAAARPFLPNPRASLFEDSSPVRSGAALRASTTIEKGLDADQKHDMQRLRLKHAASRVKFTDGPPEQDLAATIAAGCAVGVIIGHARQPAFAGTIRCRAGPAQFFGGGPSNWESAPALAAASLLHLLAPIHCRSRMKGARSNPGERAICTVFAPV